MKETQSTTKGRKRSERERERERGWVEGESKRMDLGRSRHVQQTGFSGLNSHQAADTSGSQHRLVQPVVFNTANNIQRNSTQ